MGWQSLLHGKMYLNIQFIVTPEIKAEIESSKKVMGNSIILNSLNITKRSLVLNDASQDVFGHIILQRKESNVFEARAEATNKRT